MARNPRLPYRDSLSYDLGPPPKAEMWRMKEEDEDIVIVGAARTPVGSFNGTLASVPAHTLGEVAIRAALDRAKVAPADVDEVIMGQVLTAGEGQNPARQAAIAAGVPIAATAWGVNQVCGSGLRAVRAEERRGGTA